MVWNSEKTAHEELVPETAVKETRGLTREGDTLGYARISTVGQDAAGQQDRLLEAGAILADRCDFRATL